MPPDDAMPADDARRPEITYPCRWSYRVVGSPEEGIRALILEVVGEDEHEIHGARPSSKGTYVAVHLSVLVRDDAHRTGLYNRLLAADIVKTVL